jgi:hypothetical protein
MKHLYQCELCGSVYDTVEACNECEYSHKAPKRVIGANWHTCGDIRYPEQLVATFEDNEGEQTIVYVRSY